MLKAYKRAMHDLFQRAQRQAATAADYTAADIEVLEGLEPVRRRPGMFIGGTDERALHHLVAELLDNAMDEAVAGHASWIEIRLEADGTVTVRDNGRGIPVDPHPKFPDRSALEVIMTTLHSGGKFGAKVYQTAGGLHGVGLSVVNALAEELTVEVARNRQLWRQRYVRGRPTARSSCRARQRQPARHHGALPARPRDLRRGRALPAGAAPPHGAQQGLPVPRRRDPLAVRSGAARRQPACPSARCSTSPPGSRTSSRRRSPGASASPSSRSSARPSSTTAPAGSSGRSPGRSTRSPTPASTATPCRRLWAARHEQALRNALVRALRAYGELTGNRKVAQVTADDLLGSACVLLSLFIQNPQFQGQTKEKLVAPEAGRQVELTLKDHFDHWLSGHAEAGRALLDHVLARAEERLARKRSKEVARKTRDAQAAPARQARRLHASMAARAPRSSWSRAIPPAARPSRRGCARPRRSCRCAARS